MSLIVKAQLHDLAQANKLQQCKPSLQGVLMTSSSSAILEEHPYNLK